jgi:hypothetical protein
MLAPTSKADQRLIVFRNRFASTLQLVTIAESQLFPELVLVIVISGPTTCETPSQAAPGGRRIPGRDTPLHGSVDASSVRLFENGEFTMQRAIDWGRFVRTWVVIVVIELAACAAFYLPFIEVFRRVDAGFTPTAWGIRVAGFVALAFFFVLLYATSLPPTDNAIGFGARFGITVGAFVLSGYVIGFSFGKMSTGALGVHAAGSLIKFLIAGVVTSYLYRPRLPK